MAAHAFDLPLREFCQQVAAFGVGCTLLHSTFCVLNDIFDRDLDGLVGEYRVSWRSRRLINAYAF